MAVIKWGPLHCVLHFGRWRSSLALASVGVVTQIPARVGRGLSMTGPQGISAWKRKQACMRTYPILIFPTIGMLYFSGMFKQPEIAVAAMT